MVTLVAGVLDARRSLKFLINVARPPIIIITPTFIALGLASYT